ncbi:MAG: penicillin-binding protein 2 [Propionibacteriales bacterium]|nr:penicillin-binding protein 2 [Propionibacteriales bacterium]
MTDHRRLRLLVVRVLVLSLFVTLFARLWYIQVVAGDSYQAQAADNAVREVITPPERGLIVDSAGRTLVASRTSWVITVDRTTLDKMAAAKRSEVLRRVAQTTGIRYWTIVARTKRCGEAGAKPPPVCWNGSPYQGVPVAQDVDPEVAVSVQQQTEDFPGVVAEPWQVRAYPTPEGVNAAHLLGYLSPITEEELAKAEEDKDTSLNPVSVVGRAGLERSYDTWLRGVPGVEKKAVDSRGRVLDTVGVQVPSPGDTLVTNIDAKVQSVVEKQLRKTILDTRKIVDEVTGRKYVADAGAAVVLDVKTGGVVAMASFPTYDPDVWVGGIGDGELDRLYSTGAGTPLLSRATQGQFAPGSTFKPFMTAGALSNGYDTDTRLNCSSSFRVGNRDFKNYESGAYGPIGFDQALQLSCNTFFYRVGYDFWQRAGADPKDVTSKDALVRMAEAFGFGEETGVDVSGEASGRIADRRWKLQYWKSNKDYYCKLGKEDGYDFIHRFAREFCVEGYQFRAGDAVNFAIGQGDTIVTPLQLATAYAALGNGGTLWKPRVGKAIVSPEGDLVKRIKPQKASKLPVSKGDLRYIDEALKGTTRTGTSSWRFLDFPLDEVKVRSKTGSAEVHGKQSTSWLASYTNQYAVVMMVSQGGTGSGTSGPAVRKIWESLYGVTGTDVRTAKAAQPGARPPTKLPRFLPDGSIEAPRKAAAR